MIDQDYLPGWVKTLLTILLSGGAVKLLSVLLENRRLVKKDYRETMLARIAHLEQVIAQMQTAHTELSVKLALVTDENEELRTQIKSLQDHAE
jgi:hypothetical protein